MELPANLMTPTIFCQRVQAAFEGIANVEIFVRDEGAHMVPLLRNPFHQLHIS